MWLEQVDELFKNYLPCYLLIFLPIFIIVSPVNPVMGSHEFPIYRMQHFDLHGVPHGCRSVMVNLEARSLSGWSTSRHCVITKLQELTIEHFHNIRTKAGALLVILPHDFANISAEEKVHLLLLENAMLAQEITIPVYFIKENNEILQVLADISIVNMQHLDDKSKSATEAMLSSISANGYQIVINPKNPVARNDIKVATIQGNLVGNGLEGKTQTIAIVAHYDSFGIAPELSFGADSNASGVAMLLELIRLFSNLYNDPKTHGAFNLVFLLTGAGKMNYQGSKKWLEDQLDSLDGSIIQEASYVMCLDSMTSSTDTLYMHVSKPPKDGSPASQFFRDIKTVAGNKNNGGGGGAITVEGVHKKINLADDMLAWEHERYSIRRLPAFTLSSIKSHKDMNRATILDTRETFDLDVLVRNTQIVADTLANNIYNVSGNVFGGTLKVERAALETWVNHLSAHPRSAQLLCNKDNAIVALLKDTFSAYLRDVKVTHAVPDKRDPDFVFYDVTRSVINIYSVKPAFFDLILTIAIVVYLVSIYFALIKFPTIYNVACGLTNKKQKVN